MTPYHCVKTAAKRLLAAGFQRVPDEGVWNLSAGNKYFFTRAGTSIIAFVVPQGHKPGMGFNMIAAHTDSPNLRLKPISKSKGEGVETVRLCKYGGILGHTWFDRDLSIAGRVIVKDGKAPGAIKPVLVDLKEPVARVTSLAIHLDRTQSDQFKFNKEEQFVALVGLDGSDLGVVDETATAGRAAGSNPSSFENGADRHSKRLINAIASAARVAPVDVLDFDLQLYDVTGTRVGGFDGDLLYSPRLDNQLSCFVALEALLNMNEASLVDERRVLAVAMFDHEEVGSRSAQGAGSTMINDFIKRMTFDVQGDGAGACSAELAVRDSFFVSADMAHAVHPCHPNKHDRNHRPKLGQGLVIKTHTETRYMTDGVTGLYMRHLASLAKVPVQDFCIRGDMGCGSTIGPIVAATCGLRTVDVGTPQLSMHSIRELCATKDVDQTYELYKTFFEQFTSIDTIGFGDIATEDYEE